MIQKVYIIYDKVNDEIAEGFPPFDNWEDAVNATEAEPDRLVVEECLVVAHIDTTKVRRH